VEAGLVLVILICGYVIGSLCHQAFRATGDKEDFGQYTFAAAVALTCGHGFIDVQPLPPALEEFVTLKRETFDCAALPAELPPVTPSLTQGLYRYLMSTVAAVWTVRGISWSVLSPLFGLVYGATLAAAYGLFRLGMGRVIAMAMTAVLAVSAIQLGYLPSLRDYAKAPFILGLMLLMGRFVVGPRDGRRALATAAGFGVLLGIGFGFRNDLLIVIPPWIAAVLLSAPRTRNSVGLKAACLAVSAAAFLLAAAPILAAYGRGSNTGHVALLGMMSAFDAPLGVAGSIYEWGHGYSDELVATMVTSRTTHATGEAIAYLSPAYDRAAAGYVLAIARDFPADVVVRAFASVVRVLDFPFTIGVHINAIPHGFGTPAVLGFYHVQQGVLRLLDGSGVIVMLAALVIVAARHPPAAVGLLAALLYFAGYPALQFHARHFFHLEFIAWGALGFLMQQAVDAARRRAPAWPPPRVMIRRVATFAVVMLTVTFGSVAGLRAYQGSHLDNLIARRYLGAAREPLPTELRPAPHGRTLIALPTLWQGAAQAEPVDAAYLVAELSKANCRSPYVTVTVRYEAGIAKHDFSRGIDARVDPAGGSTVLFIPVYRLGQASALAGLELATEDVACLASLSRVAARELPNLLVGLNLTQNWRAATLHQTVRALETANDGAGVPPAHIVQPAGARRPSLSRFEPMRMSEATFPSGPRGVAAVDGGWHVATRPAAPYVYLLGFPAEPVPAGSTLVVEGELRRGSVTIGLLKNEQWAGTFNVVDDGPFVATLERAEPGEYTLIVANWAPPRWLEEYWPWLDRRLPGFLARPNPVDVLIHRAGWIRGAPATE
jgi:hypothetical protein